ILNSPPETLDGRLDEPWEAQTFADCEPVEPESQGRNPSRRRQCRPVRFPRRRQRRFWWRRANKMQNELSLAQRARRGDRDAFAELFELNKKRAYCSM